MSGIHTQQQKCYTIETTSTSSLYRVYSSLAIIYSKTKRTYVPFTLTQLRVLSSSDACFFQHRHTHRQATTNNKTSNGESLRRYIPPVVKAQKKSSFKLCGSIMANSTWHVYGSIFVYLFMCFLCQNVITQGDSRPWYETLPAVAMDYKVHIDAGKEDCYYQYVQPGATFYVSFQV